MIVHPLKLNDFLFTTILQNGSVVTNKSRGKKILKFSLVPLPPRASSSKFLLVLLPNNLSLSRKNKLALNFLLARRTMGEKICLSYLKFNLSRAPGQVIFLPLKSKQLIKRCYILIKSKIFVQ